MKNFNTRNDLLDKLPKNLKVAELGVFVGDFAKEILYRMSPKEFFMVDMWMGTFGSGDKDGKNHTIIESMEYVYRKLRNEYAHYDNVHVIKKFTNQFLNSLNDNYLDMVYIDADHSYNGVMSDLEISFKKVHNSGIISGHDYISGGEVFAAVNDFCKNYDQAIIATTNDGCPSFLIQISK